MALHFYRQRNRNIETAIEHVTLQVLLRCETCTSAALPLNSKENFGLVSSFKLIEKCYI